MEWEAGPEEKERTQDSSEHQSLLPVVFLIKLNPERVSDSSKVTQLGMQIKLLIVSWRYFPPKCICERKKKIIQKKKFVRVLPASPVVKTEFSMQGMWVVSLVQCSQIKQLNHSKKKKLSLF